MKKFFLILFLLVFWSAQISAQDVSSEANQNDTSLQMNYTQLLTLAEEGDAKAMLALGSCYEHGQGVARNFVSAMEWYEKAANAGLPEGLYNLGICYEIGMGNPGNPKKALENFEKAADLGLYQAMEKLSSMYFSGGVLPQDNKKGIFWLKKAAKTGSSSANNTLGLLYLHGLMGEKKNEKNAIGYFMKAADTGRLDSIRNLGRIYAEELFRRKNPEEALKWYLIAQKGGDTTKDLDLIIGDLKKDMKAIDIVIAEKEAEYWLREYLEKTSGK